MAHDVYLCYASPDLEAAQAICAALEASDIRCWMVPRDIQTGARRPEAIVAGIRASRIMLVVVSSHSNNSRNVAEEVACAADAGVWLFPLKIEDVALAPQLGFFLSSFAFIAAFPPPLADHLPTVVKLLRQGLPPQSGHST